MTRLEREKPSLSGREDNMPKFILATAASLFRRPFPPAAAEAHDPLHETMHATTRSRDATRRLRASRIHDPYFDLSPLELTKRH
jgi:hypothetical protein